jgi:hypothetical protein
MLEPFEYGILIMSVRQILSQMHKDKIEMDRIAIRLPKIEKNNFSQHCTKQGRTVTDLLRDLMRKEVEGNR